MYEITHFAIDKALAAVYEGIAIVKIEQWYRSQGLRVHARYNEENGLTGKRGYDLVDSLGMTWECKCDKCAIQTDRIFVSASLRYKSIADYVIYMIPPGAWILPRRTLLELPTSGQDSVGDDKSERGDYIDLQVFQAASELI